MSDRESIKQDHINDLLAEDAAWREQYEWRKCNVCGIGCDPWGPLYSCEEDGCDVVMCRDCKVEDPRDSSCAVCPTCAKAMADRVFVVVGDC